jgi:hypothetical protein
MRSRNTVIFFRPNVVTSNEANLWTHSATANHISTKIPLAWKVQPGRWYSHIRIRWVICRADTSSQNPLSKQDKYTVYFINQSKSCKLQSGRSILVETVATDVSCKQFQRQSDIGLDLNKLRNFILYRLVVTYRYMDRNRITFYPECRTS